MLCKILHLVFEWKDHYLLPYTNCLNPNDPYLPPPKMHKAYDFPLPKVNHGSMTLAFFLKHNKCMSSYARGLCYLMHEKSCTKKGKFSCEMHIIFEAFHFLD